MKMRFYVMSCLALLCCSLGWAKTAMTSSGENGNIYSGHWNMANGTAGATFVSGHMSRALKITDNFPLAIQGTWTDGDSGWAGRSGMPLFLAGMETDTGSLNLWKQAHGYSLDSGKTVRGGKENQAWNLGGPVDAGDVFPGGLQKNGFDTISPVFTGSGVPPVSTWHSDHPVNVEGTGVHIQDACLPDRGGQVVDLPYLGSGGPEIVLSGDPFVMTWQQETDSASQSFINVDFSNGLLGLDANGGISSITVMNDVPVLTVLEPATAGLCLLGALLLLMRRRVR